MHVVARVPAILTAIAALAVSAAPVASAGPSKGIVTDNKDPDKLGAVAAIVYNGHAGLGTNIKALKRYRSS